MSDDLVDQLAALDLTNEVTITSRMPVFTGLYSVIFTGRYRGEMVAVKILRIVSHSIRSMRRKVTRERDVWSHLDHPNIVPMYGFAEDEELFGLLGALISPWYSNGDADKYLQAHRSSMSLDDRITLWQGVVSGVCYLHNNNPVIIHGDLKPGNILIDDAGSPRICDFGLVHIFLEEGHSGLTTTSAHTGTERYLAPELVRDEDRPTRASDVFALGCIGLEFLFSRIPYSHHNNNRTGRIFADILKGVPPATCPSVLSQEDAELWTLLESCWRGDATLRATASQISEALQRTGITNESATPPNNSQSEIDLPSTHSPPNLATAATTQPSTSGVPHGHGNTPSNPAPPPLSMVGPTNGVNSSAVHRAHGPISQPSSGLIQGGGEVELDGGGEEDEVDFDNGGEEDEVDFDNGEEEDEVDFDDGGEEDDFDFDTDGRHSDGGYSF